MTELKPENRYTAPKIIHAISAIFMVVAVVHATCTHGGAECAIVEGGHLFYLNHAVRIAVSWESFMVSAALFICIGVLWLAGGIVRLYSKKERDGSYALSLMGIGIISYFVYKIVVISKAMS